MSRFVKGETKVRPGIYFRETVSSANSLIGSRNGVVAVAFKANWGPLNTVITLDSPAEIYEYFGDDKESGSNVGILEKIFMGGASVIKAVRVGTGGTKAAITLKDDDETDVVTLTAKYAGARALSITIKDSIVDTSKRECIVYTGTKELMKVTFAKGEAEVDGIIEAVNNAPGTILDASKVAAGSGTLGDVTQTAFTTVGVSPTVTTTNYDTALQALESDKWNVVCVDTNDTAVHAVVKAFINRVNDSGLLGIAVIGEPTNVAYDTRKADCAAMNTLDVVYVLNGFRIGDVAYEGFNAAAVLAGLIAYLPSNDSLTHKVIPGATEIIDPLTNAKIVDCLSSGAIVFTVSATGAVWIEQGINTLNILSDDQDSGWKKIRRVKTRFELINRILEKTEGIVGNISNDSNGYATFIAIANGVINEMIAESKLVSGTVYRDPQNPPVDDSAWFVIDVQDLDSIEHVYITYQFSFGVE